MMQAIAQKEIRPDDKDINDSSSFENMVLYKQNQLSNQSLHDDQNDKSYSALMDHEKYEQAHAAIDDDLIICHLATNDK